MSYSLIVQKNVPMSRLFWIESIPAIRAALRNKHLTLISTEVWERILDVCPILPLGKILSLKTDVHRTVIAIRAVDFDCFQHCLISSSPLYSIIGICQAISWEKKKRFLNRRKLLLPKDLRQSRRGLARRKSLRAKGLGRLVTNPFLKITQFCL